MEHVPSMSCAMLDPPNNLFPVPSLSCGMYVRMTLPTPRAGDSLGEMAFPSPTYLAEVCPRCPVGLDVLGRSLARR